MAGKTKEQKAKIIEELQQTFAKSNVGVLTDYRGLKTADLTRLRRKLQEAGGEYAIVKNTLARSAAEKAGKTGMTAFLEGPVAIAFGTGDQAKSVKIVADFGREMKATQFIKGGFLGDRMLTVKEVATLATLPSREVLLGKVVGQMQSPISTFLAYLASPLQGVLGILQNRIKQMEGN